MRKKRSKAGGKRARKNKGRDPLSFPHKLTLGAAQLEGKGWKMPHFFVASKVQFQCKLSYNFGFIVRNKFYLNITGTKVGQGDRTLVVKRRKNT